jgi:hypothetical protein
MKPATGRERVWLASLRSSQGVPMELLVAVGCLLEDKNRLKEDGCVLMAEGS